MTNIAKVRQLGSSLMIVITQSCRDGGINPGDYVYFTLQKVPSSPTQDEE